MTWYAIRFRSPPESRSQLSPVSSIFQWKCDILDRGIPFLQNSVAFAIFSPETRAFVIASDPLYNTLLGFFKHLQWFSTKSLSLKCSFSYLPSDALMEILSVRPLSISSISNLPNPRFHFPSSLFKFNSKKSRNPPNPNTLKIQCNYNPPTETLLHTIRDFALTRKWVSRVRDSVKSEFSETKGGEFLQSSGIGMTLLSTTTAAARVHISPFIAMLAANPTFVSALLAWALAQTMKVLLNFFVDRKWDLRILFSSGGMPSSHSALCMALTTSVALCHGVGDSLFPVCLGFSLIVMYDATGVRRHAGMQAEVLNLIIEDLFQWHPISQRKLKELLGHTPSQVIAGALLGILVACFCCQGCLVAA